MTTEFVKPTHADAVPDVEVGDTLDKRSEFGDDADALVAEALVIVAKVLISSTDSAVRYLDNDLGWARVAMSAANNNVSRLGSLENGKVDAHDCFWGMVWMVY